MIKIYQNPPTHQWDALCQRPQPEATDLGIKVEKIMNQVASQKDQALFDLTLAFDRVSLKTLQVSDFELGQAQDKLDDKLIEAIQLAKRNIETFHQKQSFIEERIETMKGVMCWRIARPIERVGLYIPGGSAPLFSTVLMLAVPARIAGCKEVILCTPPQLDGSIHPAILYAAMITGVTKLYKVGGAQAIAAMALGTESIPKVDKIFGPGNHFVTQAKIAAQQLGVAIDLPAGPSEVLIIADASAHPEFIAADMLSQAEHGADSQVVLVTNDLSMVSVVEAALLRQLDTLPRAEIARKALEKSMIVYFDNLDSCILFSNVYAPEHLILSVADPEALGAKVINAGSVFMGHFSPESIGDYASGTNHTLPTGGWAHSYSGVSLDSYLKKITFQHLSEEGLSVLGPHVEVMAEAESLVGHQRAVSIRLKSLK